MKMKLNSLKKLKHGYQIQTKISIEYCCKSGIAMQGQLKLRLPSPFQRLVEKEFWDPVQSDFYFHLSRPKLVLSKRKIFPSRIYSIINIFDKNIQHHKYTAS